MPVYSKNIEDVTERKLKSYGVVNYCVGIVPGPVTKKMCWVETFSYPLLRHFVSLHLGRESQSQEWGKHVLYFSTSSH